MAKRGRKSAASLAVVPVTGIRPTAVRLTCPGHLSTAVAEVWRTVIASRPSDFFDAGAGPLLESYCTATSEHRRLSVFLADLDPVGDIDTLAKVTRLLDAHAARIGSCATRLRLTNQSRYTPGKAGTLAAAGGSSADRTRANYQRSHDEG